MMAGDTLTVQMIGLIAFCISLFSVQFKSQKMMWGLESTSDLSWAAHYFLLGGLTPAFIIIVGVMRTLLSVFVLPQHKFIVIMITGSITLGFCLMNIDGDLRNLLPALSPLIYGFAIYYSNHYVKSRCLMAAGYLLWLTIGVVFHSYIEVIACMTGLLSLAIGFYRHGKMPTQVATAMA